jgi:hypothetical protein
MDDNIKAELDNFAVTIKQFCKAVGVELPRYKGMAESVERAANDLRKALRDSTQVGSQR